MQNGKSGNRMFEVYRNKKVFVTGNTGFKGSWLCAILQKLNVNITGFALVPDTNPNHFNILKTEYETTIGNILNKEKLESSIQKAQPDIIFHLAAQSLVSKSYAYPIDTYQTNVIGTLNLLEAARKCESVKSIILVTTDKVYENKEWDKPYSESDELGGHDLYSSSKACCEILVKSYRNSFFNLAEYKKKHNVLIASVRAGNVIGGGDWNEHRLIPDISVAASKKEPVLIRNLKSVRPWQHVLDCLSGYLLLGAKLLEEDKNFAEAWNFSPPVAEVKTVEDVVMIAKKFWSDIAPKFSEAESVFHEANLLTLDSSKAVAKLNWHAAWDTTKSIQKTIEWYRYYYTEKKISTADNIVEYLKDIKQ